MTVGASRAEPTTTRQPALAPSPQTRPAPTARALPSEPAAQRGPFWMSIRGPDPTPIDTFWIVEALDVVEHVGFRLIPRPVDFTRCAFGLERREEALHCRIVPDIARAAHRADDAVICHQPLELLAAVLAAAI